MLNIFSAIGSRLTHGTPRHTRSRRTNMDGAAKWKAISANTRGHEHPFPYSTTMLKPPDTFPKPSNWRNKQNPFLPGVSARCSFSRLTMLTPRNLLLIPTNPLRWRKFAFHETRLFDETDRCRGLQGDLGNGGEHYPEIQGWPVRTDLNRNVELCKQKNVDKKHKPTAAQKVRDEGMGWEKTFSFIYFFKENLSSAKPSA